jgi:uncharacterized protein YigE (DUF2233 family)
MNRPRLALALALAVVLALALRLAPARGLAPPPGLSRGTAVDTETRPGLAEPAPIATEGPIAPGVTVHTLRSATTSWRVVTLDLRVARLHLSGQRPAERRTFPALDRQLRGSGQRLLVGMNAGIFEDPSLPTGLFVSDGEQFHGLNRAAGDGNFYWKPNGVFWVDAAGGHVAPTAHWPGSSAEVLLATQSGPVLATGGTIQPGVAASTTRHNIRNGVGVSDPWTVHLAISTTPVSFAEMADLFVTGLGATDALYLDGTISALCVDRACAEPSMAYAGILGVWAPADG